MIRFFYITILFLSCSCLYKEVKEPDVEEFLELPSKFLYLKKSSENKKDLYETPWWTKFNEPYLSFLIEKSFSSNLSLKASWRRLDQAVAIKGISSSDFSPKLNLEANSIRVKSKNKKNNTNLNSIKSFSTYDTEHLIRGNLSYEVDIWGRVRALDLSSKERIKATRKDVENTALIIASSVTKLFFSIKEKKMLLKLLNEQLKTNKTLLDLIELRLSLGKSSSIDFLQQKENLLSIKAQILNVKEELEKLTNQLSVITTISVPDIDLKLIDTKLKNIPKFKNLITPLDLLTTRPDLRSNFHTLKASRYDIKEAIANRFPVLGLSLTHELTSFDISDGFVRRLSTLLASLMLSVVDGGKKSSRVKRKESISKEIGVKYAENFLNAVLEVENALVEKRYNRERLLIIKKQEELLKKTLKESTERYLNGLSDYLLVITSLQKLQNLQRSRIREETKLFITRCKLYSAIGGKWSSSIKEK